MINESDTAYAYIERVKSRGSGYLDAMTASSDEEFESAFDAILAQSVAGLEKNKKLFASLSEEGLTAALALALTIPGLSVTQETHSNGHVDLTIEADHCFPRRTKLAEAKIYAGFAYHVKGLEQLLQRYSTGREVRGLLIEYVRLANVSGLMQGLRENMDERRPCNQASPTGDYGLKWSFLSKHNHSCGDVLEVCHVGCNMYCEA